LANKKSGKPALATQKTPRVLSHAQPKVKRIAPLLGNFTKGVVWRVALNAPGVIYQAGGQINQIN
jgi:hypothetical protein